MNPIVEFKYLLGLHTEMIRRFLNRLSDTEFGKFLEDNNIYPPIPGYVLMVKEHVVTSINYKLWNEATKYGNMMNTIHKLRSKVLLDKLPEDIR